MVRAEFAVRALIDLTERKRRNHEAETACRACTTVAFAAAAAASFRVHSAEQAVANLLNSRRQKALAAVAAADCAAVALSAAAYAHSCADHAARSSYDMPQLVERRIRAASAAAAASVAKLRRRYPPLFDGTLGSLSTEEAGSVWSDRKAAEAALGGDDEA